MPKCPKCKGELVQISKHRILPDPNYVDMTDEELIEFFAEDITGDYKKWGADRIEYKCENCGKHYIQKKK